MIDPGNRFAKLNVTAKISTAALALFLENFVAAFFWLLVWISAFICIWLSDYTDIYLTILFWIGIAALYLWGLSKFIVPQRADILHRMEQASSLKHRPLTSLKDIQITLGREEMWQLEKSRQLSLLAKLRHTKPDLQLSRRDPYAIRILFVLFLICAAFITRSDFLPRIKSGLFFTAAGETANNAAPFAQIKITPPSYTGLKTIFLTHSVKPFDILAGSKLEIQVQPGWGNPVLHMGQEKIFLNRKDKLDVWAIETPVTKTDTIKITTYGIPRFNQKIIWREDSPPIIGWNGKIDILPSGEMRIPLKIADDFGIGKLTLHAILAPGEDIPVFGSPLAIEKKINLVIRDSIDIKPIFDTTGHPWAGKRASILVEAEDFAGNISETEPLDIVLPERSFRNPVAARLAAIRSNLLNLRGVISDVTGDIEVLLYNPDQYKWDTLVTLGLRSIDSRLHYSHQKEAMESSASMMWSLAMRLEEGKIGETQQSLKTALEKLQTALQKGADKAEIAALMQQVQQALLQHLQNIAQKLKQNGEALIAPPQNSLNMNALSAFLKKLQDDIAKGDTNSAMQKLNALQQLADNLGSQAGEGMPRDMQEDMQKLQDLQNLIARQKKMLDRTKQGNQEDASSLAKNQKDIQADTGKTNLHEAEDEMAQSADALGKKDLPSSAAHQQKALDLMNKQAQSMQQALQKKMQAMMGLSLGSSGPEDPLGRPQQMLRDDGTRIPDAEAQKKSDTIIKTLREREGDMKRPLEERNYYQRLLKEW